VKSRCRSAYTGASASLGSLRSIRFCIARNTTTMSTRPRGNAVFGAATVAA
jgi:hypothetical protein